MLRLSKKKASPSLHALRRKITHDILASLQPILLLQMLVGVSQTVNGSVSRSRALARTLFLSGRRRLSALLDSAPHLQLSVEQMLAFCRTSDAGSTPEEEAAQALLEVCLGLMLHWMTQHNSRRHPTAMPRQRQRISPLYFPSCLSRRPPRMRSCPTIPLTWNLSE
jgi:hypothetical protein